MRGVWIGAGLRAASQEIAEPQISVAEPVGIRRKPELIRRALIEQTDSGVERQGLIGIPKASEYGLPADGIAGVGLARGQGGGSAVNVGLIAVAFAVEQVVTLHLVWRHGVVAHQGSVEFRGKRAD